MTDMEASICQKFKTVKFGICIYANLKSYSETRNTDSYYTAMTFIKTYIFKSQKGKIL